MRFSTAAKLPAWEGAEQDQHGIVAGRSTSLKAMTPGSTAAEGVTWSPQWDAAEIACFLAEIRPPGV
jgi:hypothetical protein